MKNYFIWLLLLIVLPLLSALYYFISFGEAVDRTFLSISTFLFSIFTGFFISRQAARFNRVRDLVTRFDGVMSNIFRTSSHISDELQTAIGKTIRSHYKKVFSTKKWDYHFDQKSTTLKSIHQYLDKMVDEDKVTKIANQALGAIIKGLAAAQDIRKSIVALNHERIPKEQWALIIIFAFIVISAVSTLDSLGQVLPSILKAAFVVAVVAVIYILLRLDKLIFAEEIMGYDSANDVLDLISNKK